MDLGRLEELDAEEVLPLLAIAYDRGPKHGSFAYPHAFVCEDGKTYWVKRFQHGAFGAGNREPGAQAGLVAELVAGRLGSALSVAAAAVVVEVPAVVLRRDGTTGHLEGVGVGSADQAGMENLRYLADQIPGGLMAEQLDEASVARVIAFQSWIGAGDTQVMVDLRSGRLMSIDHGEYAAFASDAPQVVVAPGLPPDFARSAAVVGPELDRIEAVSDEQILRAVAGVPEGPEWRSGREKRARLAESLALRRDRVREAFSGWLT